jgi:hypothetical protein
MKLDRRRRGGGGGGAIDMAPSSGLESDSEEHVLPGGVGTFSIRQVASATRSRGEAAGHGVVSGAFPPAVHVSRTEEGPPHGAESGARAHSGPLAMWQDSGVDQRSRGENLYIHTLSFFLLSGRFQNSGPSFITLPCCMFRRERRGGEKQRQQRRSGAQHTEIQAFRYRAAETDKDKRQAMLVESNFNFHQLHLADQKLKKNERFRT